MSLHGRSAIARASELVLVTVLAAAASGGCGFEAKSTGDDVEHDAGTDPANACEGVPVEGMCTSSTELARCVDGAVQVETCASVCFPSEAGAVCASPEVCDTIGPLGRCDGDTLWRCDGMASVTDCTGGGQVCGYRDDAVGYGCVDAATLGSLRMSGTIRWEDRALSPGMLAAPVEKPARGVMVAVVDDATNELISTVSAADDGTYVAHYAAPVSGTVRVVTYSRSRAAARPARVRDTAGYLHAVGSAPFAAGAMTGVDVTITASSSAGGAWNSLDNAVTAMDWLRARGIATISPVYMYWQRETPSGSYYQGGTNELHLDGDDGFDDVVALHELGHYMQDEYSISHNPGGAHDGSPADPRLAWGEGGATWFAIAIRGVPYYIDYSPGGGWSVELEDRVHEASITGAMSQNVSEWMVAEVMWDLTDDTLRDGDPVDGTASQVWDVMVGYLLSAQMIDRGRPGMDLVELLDGWFMHHGMTTCAAMRTLLRDKYGFPYDFTGPAGACP